MRGDAGSRDDKFPIGELSRHTGVTIETIRYYERIALLAAPPRTSAGRRLYDFASVRQLAFIRRARDLGFSLDEIRSLLRLGGPQAAMCCDVRDIAAVRLEDVRAKLRDLHKVEQLLAATVARCSGEPVTECAVLDILDIARPEISTSAARPA